MGYRPQRGAKHGLANFWRSGPRTDGRTDGRWTNKGAERFVGRALCVMVKSEIFAHCTAKEGRKEGMFQPTV